MKKAYHKISNLITFLAGIIAIADGSVNLLSHVGIQFPKKIFTNIFSILFFKIPIIWIIWTILIIGIIAYFFQKRKTIENVDDKKINRNHMEDEIDIDIRSRADQIVFYLPHDGIPNLQIWLKIINKSSLEFSLDKIKWELWIGQFKKSGESSDFKNIEQKGTRDNVLIESNLSDAEAECISNKDNNGAHIFRGVLFFSFKGNSYKKEFSLNEVKFEIRGVIKKEEFELTGEHY
jgi:hypothetical protein